MPARLIAFLVLVLVSQMSARSAQACEFSFEIDAQSTAFDSLVSDAMARGGFWRSIQEAPDDVQAIGRFVGRLDVCMRTEGDVPATVTFPNGGQMVLQSPYISHCTATLLPGNRLLTNHHCYFSPRMREAGFRKVAEARIHFGYTSKDFTGSVQSFSVGPAPLLLAPDLDAMVLQVTGGDAVAALGGHIPMAMLTEAPPRRALTMIHHPNGEPLQFSSGTCQVDTRQADLPPGASQLRHRCETAPGSSGSLLFDARTLSVIGLHNSGGLGNSTGYNAGHRIAAIESALGLGFVDASVRPDETPPVADAALFEALLLTDIEAKRVALSQVISDFPGSDAANRAALALASLPPAASPPPPLGSTPKRPGVTALDPTPEPTPAPIRTASEIELLAGLTVAVLTDPLRTRFGVAEGARGVIVTSVAPGSAGAQSGLLAGDVISEADQTEVLGLASLSRLVQSARNAEKSRLLLLVQRDGAPRFVALRLPPAPVQTDEGEPDSAPLSADILGMTVTVATPQLRAAFGLQERLSGLVITRIAPDSPAQEQRFGVGDLITAADGTPVRKIGDLENAVDAARARYAETIRLVVYYEGGRKRDWFTLALAGGLPDLPMSDPGNVLGMKLHPLTPEMRVRFGIPVFIVEGAVILEIDPNSQAYQRGVRPGGVITNAHLDKVFSPETFARTYDEARRGGLSLFQMMVNQRGRPLWVALKLSTP